MKYPEGLVPISFRDSSPTLLKYWWHGSKHGKPGRNKTTVVEAETFFLKTREDGRTHSRYRLIDTAASFV